jgi:hypothetical protein
MQPVDPWRMRLERVRGQVGFDGLERISSQSLQRQRTTCAYRYLATLMAELGWRSRSDARRLQGASSRVRSRRACPSLTNRTVGEPLPQFNGLHEFLGA